MSKWLCGVQLPAGLSSSTGLQGFVWVPSRGAGTAHQEAVDGEAAQQPPLWWEQLPGLVPSSGTSCPMCSMEPTGEDRGSNSEIAAACAGLCLPPNLLKDLAGTGG